ncbi:flavin-containing monooxygenase [Actinokineospora xionganensis]|uniref:flavin-containing monooxygenase n=1 Tax=Actinokineospora xionganensis TaxID=2684470 RepID=UPI001FE52D4D|nr:NAD(P)/FAD-dependent oxidoreductase [Actinokineospora xionganensis]
MTTQHIETLIIGAGQAGLSTGYHLRELGRPFLIVDGNDRVGDNWRRQWDTLRLYTPAKYSGLPGQPFPLDGWAFPHKDEVADYLETYALHWDLSVRMSTRIDLLEARPEGGYTATIGADTITCDNAVVATGTFRRTPYIPAFAGELGPSIRQPHSSEYRRPGQLRPGKVLVVGASHSGTDIAYEVAPTHETVLCGRDCGEIPVRMETRRFRAAYPLLAFAARHVLTRGRDRPCRRTRCRTGRHRRCVRLPGLARHGRLRAGRGPARPIRPRRGAARTACGPAGVAAAQLTV